MKTKTSTKTKKNGKTKKTAAKRGAKPVEFYVVSYANYDNDNRLLDGGTFASLYSTKEKAWKDIEESILDAAEAALDAYCEDEREEVFGTTDAKELARKMVVSRRKNSISYHNPDTGVDEVLIVSRYSTEWIV